MVILKRGSGGLLPKAQGNFAEGALAPYATWLRERIAAKGDLTLDEIVAELAAVHGLCVHRGSVGKWPQRLGVSHKKTLLASEQLRLDVVERRRVWIETRQPEFANMLERLVFIDETSLKTNLVKTTGWAPVGKRLVDHAPSGHWHTQTFIAGLGCDGNVAPWLLDGAMNRDSFETYVEHVLAPALRPGRSSSPTTSPPTNPRAPSNFSARKATTSSSCRPIRPTLASLRTVHCSVFLTLITDRDGLLQTENPHPQSSRQKPTKPYGPLSEPSAIFSSAKNAETTSKPQAMKSFEGDTLQSAFRGSIP